MTVSTLASQSIVYGNGATTSFSFSFIPDSASAMQVSYTDINNNTVILSPATYTLTINAPATNQIWGQGGTVVYPLVGSPIAFDTYLTIQRIVPLTQPTSISDQGNFYPEAVETAIDNLCFEIQQVGSKSGLYRGTWATDVSYSTGDMVVDGVNGNNTLNYYTCNIANTSGTWSTDLANGDWTLMIDITGITADVAAAAASAAAALVSQNAAATSATNAATSATTATTQAGIATTEAGIATTQATNAATSASSASTSASTATTQAGIATTQAGIATTQAGIATTQATNASTSATNAATSATAAAASAVLAGTALTATSTTANTIGTGSFTFTIQANKNFFAGQTVIAASNANAANYIHGTVSSYSGTTFIMAETDNGGSGSHSDWNISVSGTQGTAGTGTGTVTSVTFTGDGTVLSSTPSGAVTTSGTVTAALASAAAKTVLGNATAGSAAPTYTTDPVVSGTSTANKFTSTVATGTAPLVVSSTTQVANLNAATAGNASTVTTNANLTGDVTSSGNATTLATVNSNVGSFTAANITVNAKGLVTAASSGSSVVYNAIAGLIPSAQTFSSNTSATMTISSGQAADSTNTTMLSGGSFSWSVANGNAINGYQGGTTIPNSSTIHFYIITKADGSIPASFGSTSLTPTLPATYTLYRRIFSIVSNSSGVLLAASNSGATVETAGGAILYYLATQLCDINVSNLSTSRTLYTLTVPSGIRVQPITRASTESNVLNSTTIFTSPDETDVAPTAYTTGSAYTSAPGFDFQSSAGAAYANKSTVITSMFLTTNTSAQIGARASAASTLLDLDTRGWIDYRRI